MKFEIPAQPAPAALMLFSKQARVEVVFSADDLKTISANEVLGELEPEEAIARLLKGTGFAAQRNAGGKFVVTRAEQPGSVKGTLVGEGGKALPEVFVTVRETAQSATTGRNGEYFFPTVAAGSYTLVATAPGYQPLHITDVVVRAGRDLTLGKEQLQKPLGETMALEPFIVRADSVTELDKFEITGTKQRPFSSGNMDVARTTNDVQAYYIFNAEAIERSGAVDVEGFLKQHLAMNAAAFSNNQQSARNLSGNTSSINLRGLGADKTLVLVNGRRRAGVTVSDGGEGLTGQPDVNGIPLAAIERIEVLPSSASGIHGGSAIGGVVNIILKRDYTGGEVRATYKNTFDTDAPTRAVALNYGQSFADGRGSFGLSLSRSDSEPMLMQDRLALWDRGVSTVMRNSPEFFGTSDFPPLGGLPNIASPFGETLILRATGASIGSTYTHIPAGTTAATPAAMLAAGLLANAGQYVITPPAGYQQPNGLFSPIGGRVRTEAYLATLRREIFSGLEAFAEFSHDRNERTGIQTDPIQVYVPGGVAFSPFQNDVWITVPSPLSARTEGLSTTTSFTAGVLFKLPYNWTGNLDYTRSLNRYRNRSYLTDLGIWSSAAIINYFVDTIANPPAGLADYSSPVEYDGRTILDDFAWRSAGPISFLPWGEGRGTIGLERRVETTPENEFRNDFQFFTWNSKIMHFYRREQATDSVYGEVQLPLLRQDAAPFLHGLDFQFAGRVERFAVDTGTVSLDTNPDTGAVSYTGPTLNGEPFSRKSRYTSESVTTGLKFMPTQDFAIRASVGTAFLPPRASQLVADTIPQNNFGVLDPVLNQRYIMPVLGGGSPGLKPQTSESFNAGVIWQPVAGALEGLRVNVEYYRTKQHDAIATLNLTTLLSMESSFPDRIVRDPVTGRVTFVDNTAMNLYLRDTAGWDLSLDFRKKTGFGILTFGSAHSYITDLKIQYSPVRPPVDAAGYSPAEEGAPRYKAAGSLAWERHGWSAGWTARYIHSYKQYGAPGGPRDVSLNGSETLYVKAQGADTVGSQLYHDLHISYAFALQRDGGAGRSLRWRDRLLEGMSVQLVVNNVFDRAPPVDVFYGMGTGFNFFLSPYGDLQLRNFALSLRKRF